jgi:hypothetical protein
MRTFASSIPDRGATMTTTLKFQTPDDWRSIFPPGTVGQPADKSEIVGLAARFGLLLPPSVESLLIALSGTVPSPLGDISLDLPHLTRSNELVRENAMDFDDCPWPQSLFVIASRIGLEVALIDTSTSQFDPEVLLMSTLDDTSAKLSVGPLSEWGAALS